MWNRTVAVSASLLVLCGLAGAAEAPEVVLYLPRSISVDGGMLELSSISVIRCKDDALAAKVASIAIVRAPWLKEKITIDRRTINSHLAASRIPPKTVRITGAKKVVVSRKELVIKREELLKVAWSCLNTKAAEAGRAWQLWPSPLRDLVVPAAADLKLTGRLAKKPPPGFAKVEVVVTSGKRQLALAEVRYKRVYIHQQAVAKVDIPAGGALTDKNVEIRKVTSVQPQAANWSGPIGMVARRALRKGMVIRRGMFGRPEPPIVVKRRQKVMMKIVGAGFSVTAMAVALEEGRTGEYIKVRNVDTNRTVWVRVAYDGTVEPVMPEVKR